MLPKKLIAIALILCCYRGLWSQVVFCPPGAEWHYSFYTALDNSSSNKKIKYVNDSVVDNETVKVLLHDNYFNECNFSKNKLSLIKQKGDTIFMRNAVTQHAWQVLYNFACSIGQSWTNTLNSNVIPNSTYTYTITVDSIKYVTVNGFVLKQLFVNYKRSGSSFIDKCAIYERFGCSKFLFNYKSPYSVSDCDWSEYFLCYGDDQFGLKQFTEKSCDFNYHTNINGNNSQSTIIKTYPNPATEVLNISSEGELFHGEISVSIKDLTGREIKQVAINELNSVGHKIEISDLASGVYLLSIRNEDREIYTGKLLKN